MIADQDRSDQNRIEDLLVEWEQQRSRGSDPSVENLCREAPHLLPVVKKRIAELVATDWMFDTVNSNSGGHPTDAAPKQIGEYEILKCLGVGGMGSVYLARHRKLDKRVAVKVLATGRGLNSQATARFAREMRVIGKLEHPNLVAAYDAGEVEGTQYLAMQYIEGLDLDRLLKQRGRLPLSDACEVVRQAALGLQCAHENGLVHRDVKPSNLMINREGVVKVLDVGLARLVGMEEAPNQITSAGNIVGTVDFMPPEQCDDCRGVDARGDIYSLGATLFKLLCGRAPLEQEQTSTMLMKLRALAQGEIPRLADQGPFPADLARLVDQMLAPRASNRPASAALVAEELSRFCAGSNLPKLLDPPAESASQPDLPETGHRNAIAPPASATFWLIAAAIAATLGAIAFAVGIFRVETERGTIVVKAGEGVTVEVLERAGVRLKHIKSGQTFRVEIGNMPLETGEYQLEVKEETSGLQFSTRHLAIGSAQSSQLDVTLEQRPKAAIAELPQVPPGPKSSAPQLRFDRKYQMAKSFQVIFAPDGKSLLLTGDTGSVRLVDAANGAEIRRLQGHRRPSRGIAMLADGKTVVSGDEGGGIFLHRVDSGELLREVRREGANCRSIDVAPDSRSIVISSTSAVELADLATGETKQLRRGQTYQSHFDGAGKAVWAQMYQSGIFRISTDSQQAEKIIELSQTRNGYLEVHAASNTAAFVADDSRVQVLNLTTGKVVREFPARTSPLIHAAISHDTKLLAIVSANEPIRLFDFANAKEIAKLQFIFATGQVSLSFSPDDRQLAAFHTSGRLAAWQLPNDLLPSAAPEKP